MNKFLLYSSMIIGFIIIIISLFFYNKSLFFLYIITYVGIITSIINHDITCELAKNIDRFIMLLSLIIYIYYSINIKEELIKIIILSSLGIMAFLYIFSKAVKILLNNNDISTNIHLLTHCIYLLPFSMIIYYYK
jgi:hypothetical protein